MVVSREGAEDDESVQSGIKEPAFQDCGAILERARQERKSGSSCFRASMLSSKTGFEYYRLKSTCEPGSVEIFPFSRSHTCYYPFSGACRLAYI